MQDVAALTIVELDTALAATGPVTSRLPEATAVSDTLSVLNTTISLLPLVHLLLRSPLLNPITPWNLISSREMSFGLEHIVTPRLHYLWAHTSAHAEAVNSLSRIDLAGTTLQSRQDIRDNIIPPLPSDQMHTPVHFLPRLSELSASPPVSKQDIRAKELWGDTLNSLLHLCNLTAAAGLPPIWDMIAYLSRVRDRSDIEATFRHTAEHFRF